jgi:hypothetical protein
MGTTGRKSTPEREKAITGRRSASGEVFGMEGQA